MSLPFLLSRFLLNIMLVPYSLLIMKKSSSQRWNACSVVALGIIIGSGTSVYVLATSATAFMVVEVPGAAYLVQIGVSAWLDKSAHRNMVDGSNEMPPVNSSVLSIRKLYQQQQVFLTNVLNPNVTPVFLAFIPQFIEPQTAPKALAFIMLG